MTDQLSGGLPFAPQPKSYGAMAGDYLHKARLWMDEHTPGLGMAASFMGGPGSAMGPASTMGQGGVLNDPATLARMQGYVKQASPFGGDANSPKALFGPPTYPGTPGMMQADSFQPRTPAPEAPQAAPAMPAPTDVGPGRVGSAPPAMAASAPQSPSDRMGLAPYDPNGSLSGRDANRIYDSYKAAGGGGPVNIVGASAPKPAYELGARLKAAGGHLAGDGGMGFTSRNTAMMRDPVTGDFIDPQAAKQADANGPDLIKKFMNYLHSK